MHTYINRRMLRSRRLKLAKKKTKKRNQTMILMRRRYMFLMSVVCSVDENRHNTVC